MTPAIELRNVVKDYPLGRQTVHALRGLNVTIQTGEFVAFAGPSGSGKTTLLNLIGCMDVPTSGDVLIDGALTNNLSEGALTRLRLQKLGFVFQNFNLLPVLTAYQNVELPLLLLGVSSRAERRQRIEELLTIVGLGKHMNHKPLELSGGQQQRVAVARALVSRPKLVLADEPTANLDSKTGAQIIDLMHEMGRREQTTFVFSTHDAKIQSRADRVFDLVDGQIATHSEAPAPESDISPQEK